MTEPASPASAPPELPIIITLGSGHVNVYEAGKDGARAMAFDAVREACKKARDQGAKPLTAVDDISMHSMEGDWFTAFGEGLTNAAIVEGVSISGGETAQMPDTYKPGWVSVVVTVVSLRDGWNAALAESQAEVALLREDNAADADNDHAHIESLKLAIAQLCEAVGIERGNENWKPWIAGVRERFARLRSPTATGDEYLPCGHHKANIGDTGTCEACNDIAAARAQGESRAEVARLEDRLVEERLAGFRLAEHQLTYHARKDSTGDETKRAFHIAACWLSKRSTELGAADPAPPQRMTIRYMPEPNGGAYAVSLDGRFIGRVSRHRGTYEHSNGRTYRSWRWHAYPAAPETQATFHHPTRTSAAGYLAYMVNDTRRPVCGGEG